ncbi:MAG: hemerythrin domain-containing protein [Candidatus Riflebacteria bacterium]|nr:hemerythrin domain-containing protein [Candidatus Riflebacteria bacterium]
MDPIQILMNEHRLIERTLTALWAYAEQVGTPAAAPADLSRFVQFIRQFADAYHHGKEEEILFAEMVACGFPKEMGPIGVMLAEHDEGRRQVAILAEEAAQIASGATGNPARITSAARAYVSLLQQHIYKEDNILYPMAETHLPPEVMQRVMAAFEAFEEQKENERRQLVALAGELDERYGQNAGPEAQAPSPCGFCCGEAPSTHPARG